MSSCVICGIDHDNMFGKLPNMYCVECEDLKKKSIGLFTYIRPNLWLGDLVCAEMFKSVRICVHENPDYAKGGIHIPIMEKFPNSPMDRSGGLANVPKLNEAAKIIGEYVNMGIDVLVHCKGGVERSPLTVAWYLVYSMQYQTVEKAYEYLKSIRPVISPRYQWLPVE